MTLWKVSLTNSLKGTTSSLEDISDSFNGEFNSFEGQSDSLSIFCQIFFLPQFDSES